MLKLKDINDAIMRYVMKSTPPESIPYHEHVNLDTPYYNKKRAKERKEFLERVAIMAREAKNNKGA